MTDAKTIAMNHKITATDPRAGRDVLPALFERIHAALVPGGLFLFDVGEPRREPAGTRRTWHEDAGWLLALDVTEDAAAQTLTPHMAVC